MECVLFLNACCLLFAEEQTESLYVFTPQEQVRENCNKDLCIKPLAHNAAELRRVALYADTRWTTHNKYTSNDGDQSLNDMYKVGLYPFIYKDCFVTLNTL